MSTSLLLYNWRCFAQQSFSIPEESFALVDENGAGKSSLLGALYSLYTGNSWPGTKIGEHLRVDTNYFGVLSTRPDWSFSGQISGGRLHTRYQQPEAETAWPVIFTYSPDDNYWLSLPRNVKLQRLDQLIGYLNPEYLRLVTTLDKYVRAKQKLLKQSQVEFRLVLVLTRSISEISVKIWEIRKGFLDYLSMSLAYFSNWISSPLETWTIRYEITNSSGIRQQISRLKLESLDDEVIADLWRKEKIIQKVLYGAQRDEFQFENGRIRAQHALSRGENRLLTLYVKYLTQQKVKEVFPEKPLWWFLDDVYNELDSVREDILQREVLGLASFSIYSGTRGPSQTPQYSIASLRKSF